MTIHRPGDVALVTGAGSGIGRSTAVLLAREGFRLALNGRTERKLEETARLLQAEGLAPGDIAVLPADLAVQEEAERLAVRAVERWGGLHLLVNNAGWGWLRPLHETDGRLLEQTFAINFFGAASLTIRALKVFLRQGRGTVVNVSSGAAHDPFPGLGAYGAAKAALESLGRSIANEYGAKGVRAYSVAPGAVETPLLRSIFSESEIPRSQTLDPMDVARRIVDCAIGRTGLRNGGTLIVTSPA